MITSGAWRGKRYAVLGLARSGRATVEALLASGAEVMAWDSDPETRAKILPGTGRGTARSAVEGLSQAPEQPLHHAAHGPPPRTGEDLVIANPLVADLTGYTAIIVSPGVPLNTHPIAQRARNFGVPIIGDIELFAQARAELPPHKVVGITGTNGKSTTTALVHHILETAGVPTTMGGNIGLPILAQEPLPAGGVYVLELSSYQIDLTQSLDCDVAVLLNVTPDHLDRYKDLESYARSKLRLFGMQSAGHSAVVTANESIGDTWVGAMFDDVPETFDLDMRWMVAGTASDVNAAVIDRNLMWDGVTIGTQADWPSLTGPHNAQNVIAAVTSAHLLGLAIGDIAAALETYPGLPHRMERVAEKSGVLFVNDSKATNAESAAPALAAFPAVHWIVGGQAKTADLGPCAAQLDHVRGAYTIGEAGEMFARLLADKVPSVEQSETLDRAVTAAAAKAKPGEVVLLSPACASFDQFRDYEARGDAFRAAVGAL